MPTSPDVAYSSRPCSNRTRTAGTPRPPPGAGFCIIPTMTMRIVVPLPNGQPAEDSRRYAVDRAGTEQVRLLASQDTGKMLVGDGTGYNIDGSGLTFHTWEADADWNTTTGEVTPSEIHGDTSGGVEIHGRD